MFPGSSNGKGSETSTSTAGLPQRCCQFEFDEILLATDDFNESLVVGKGGFGKVYKGNIRIGTTHVDVAIKRMDLMSNQGATEFWAEVEMLSKLRHAHLVSLIGYYNYEKEMILVYEYMPHGTLEDHLHKLHIPFSWLERLKICIGAARGLDYLHTGTGIEVGVIHRDVKSSNILLHESWAAKISDFGLARIGPTNQPSTYVNTLVKGTFGYIDPNYFATGKLTRKSDVYAFGVVLFEVLCQKRPLDESFECGLATWVQKSIKEGNLKQMVYSGIRSEISPKCLKGFARIAERCLDNYPNDRPTMTEVVFSLESLLAQSVLSSQQKTNNWFQTPGKKIFGRIFDVFPFSSSGEILALYQHIAPELVPVEYGGLRREGEQEFTCSDSVTEEIIKPDTRHRVEFAAPEDCTLVWEARVVGYGITYGAEFVPEAEDSYTLIIQITRKISATTDNPLICGFFNCDEPGKVVLTFDNLTSKKKKVLYRSKTKVKYETRVFTPVRRRPVFSRIPIQ